MKEARRSLSNNLFKISYFLPSFPTLSLVPLYHTAQSDSLESELFITIEGAPNANLNG